MSGRIPELLSMGRPGAALRPWPRATASEAAWAAAIACLSQGDVTLAGLWADPREVHMALLDEDTGGVGVLSLEVSDGGFPSVGARHAPAIRLERSLRDLYGFEPRGAEDLRPWLDHGRWGVRHPLLAPTPAGPSEPYRFLGAEGEGLHQVAVGPVHAGTIEPGHFRFHANGEIVVRLEERLGYVHRGVEGLMAGAPLPRAARLAGRASGDSTVAYAMALARAVEAALGVEAPVRAHWLRGLMAELERLANHLGDIGAVCNDASFGLMLVHCSVLRETVLRACGSAFGHRLMMDQVAPGGVAADPAAEGLELIRRAVAEVERRLPLLVELYDDTASLQERVVGTGIVSPALARRFGAGGFVGRASGRAFDARRAIAYPPYGELSFDVPIRQDGDVNARVWIRIEEARQSLLMIGQILEALPEGPILVPIPERGGEGMALVEGFRGDILVWVRLGEDGRVERCWLRDPSWFQWPLLEAAIEGNIVADFPLCNKSFNCSYAGCDL